MSVSPNETSARRWESTRRKGKLKFILLSGILAWGLPMFVVMTFFVEPRQQHWPLTVHSIIVSAFIWAIIGAGFGWMIWTLTERKYQKHVAQRD